MARGISSRFASDRWRGRLTTLAACMTGLVLTMVQAEPARAACQLQQLVQLPVTMVGTRPTITVKINGKEALFLVDSGAFYSVISPAAAARSGLKTMTTAGQIKGIGGLADAGVTNVDLFTLGDLPLHGIKFLVADGAGDAVAGLIGENVLGVADVEYDLANGVVRLFKPDGCGPTDNLGYWAKGTAAELALQHTARVGSSIDASRHVKALGLLNGQRINVTFDTGAWRSILRLDSAARAGVTPKTAGAKYEGLSAGFGPRAIDTWLAPFQSFALGSEQIQNTTLRMGAVELSDTDMLLGADFFLSHRIYVANSQGKLYLTYNGGPVFRLEAALSPPAMNPDPPAPAAGAADIPTDAAGFARRGAAFAARFDYLDAIKDFTRAHDLEPTEAKHLFARARAKIGAGQPVAAIDDFDEGLKLKPDEIFALVERAALHTGAGDKVQARADLDTAAPLASADPAMSLTVADAYLANGFFEDAVVRLDQWIVANPKSNQAANALTVRCFARAVLNTNLDKALADCDASLRLKSADATSLDSRARVHLDRGDLDAAIADYNASLRARSQSAITLYGRGVAKLRKGLKEAGDADIQTAIKIRPQVAAEAKLIGLAP